MVEVGSPGGEVIESVFGGEELDGGIDDLRLLTRFFADDTVVGLHVHSSLDVYRYYLIVGYAWGKSSGNPAAGPDLFNYV